MLYSNPQVLNDITNGSNPNCGTAGFSAVSGYVSSFLEVNTSEELANIMMCCRWDPVTGLGTPNYPKLLELFLSLP